jgi:beta-galactosidase
MRRVSWALLWLGWAVVCGAAQIEEEHALSRDYVTPHVAWGKNWASGKARVLCLVEGRGTRARDLVELAQRFDLEPTAVYFERGELYGKDEGAQRLLDLLGQPWQAIVLGNVPFDKIPLEAQYRLLLAVSRGAGLVVTGKAPPHVFEAKRALPETPPALLAGTPLTNLYAARPAALATGQATPGDADVAAKIITTFQLGLGRGVTLNYHGPTATLTPNLAYTAENLAEYEYWVALAGKAILWAAGRPPLVAVGESAALLKLDRSACPQTIDTALTNLDRVAHQVQVSRELRSADGRRTVPLGTATIKLDPGGHGAVPANIPEGLPAGRYQLHLLARDKDKTLGFGAVGVQLTSVSGLESVTLEQTFVEAGETLRGAVKTREAQAGDRVRVSLRDCYHRAIAQSEQPAAAEVAFAFSVDGEATTIGMTAEAALVREGQVLETAEAAFRVPDRRRGRFNLVMWDYPPDALGYHALMRLRELGIGIILKGGEPGPVLAATDLAYIPYSTRLLDDYDAEGVMKPVCWNDEAAVSQWVQGIVDKQQGAREHGVFVYSLGDETTTKGACTHPACLQAYREWLREQYGSLEALNASWESTYRSWDEVNLLNPKDNWEQGALREGKTARWFDRLYFARVNYARLCGRFVKAYEQLDPQALTGFEGAGRFGEDYQLLVNTNGFWAPYPNLGDEVIRSIAPRGFIRANWMGYHRDADPLAAAYWRMITLGYDSVWYWRWDGFGRWHGYLAPSLDAYPAIKEMAADTRIVRDGLGDLLLQARRVTDGIGVYYSVPSAWSGTLDNSNTYTTPESASEAFVEATRDLGLEPTYLTTEKLLGDGLREVKVLVLPFIQALSDREAQVISEWVRGGGVLVADLRPGLYDGHLKRRAAGALDRLLGIKRQPAERASSVDLKLKGQWAGQNLALDLAAVPADPGVVADGATALATAGAVPLVLTHEVGQGRTVLLNFAFSAYAAHHGKPGEDQLKGLLAGLYAGAGIASPYTVFEGRGPARGVQVYRWQTGLSELVCLLPRYDRTWYPEVGHDFSRNLPLRRTVVRLPEKRHVYELKSGQYLGERDHFPAALYPGRASVYALLTYRVPPVRLRLPEDMPRRGEKAELTVALDLPRYGAALHAVKLTAQSPDGRRPWWLERVIILRDGVARVKLPIAHDEQPGRWTLKATELYTGQTSELSYTLK